MGDDVFNNRFQELLRDYPGALKYAARKSDVHGAKAVQTVEEQMQADWENFKFYKNPEQLSAHINIQFYLAELLRKCSQAPSDLKPESNLYTLLLQKLKRITDKDQRERISLVTFNYDTILDEAITQTFGYTYGNMSDYHHWADRNILLYKPHGSCNWGWKLNGIVPNGLNVENLSQWLYTNRTSLYDLHFKMIGNPEEVVATNTWGYEYHNDRNFRGRLTLDKSLIEHIPSHSDKMYYPAILIPYRDKDEFYMPYKHFYAMRQTLDKIEELYLIGWKGSEALFNKNLSRMSNLKRLVIVNPDKDEVLENIKPALRYKDSKIECVPTFEEFVLNWMPNNIEVETL